MRATQFPAAGEPTPAARSGLAVSPAPDGAGVAGPEPGPGRVHQAFGRPGQALRALLALGVNAFQRHDVGLEHLGHAGDPGLLGLRVGGFELVQVFLKPDRGLPQPAILALHVSDVLPGVPQDYGQVFLTVVEAFAERSQVSLEPPDFLVRPLFDWRSSPFSGFPFGHFRTPPKKNFSKNPGHLEKCPKTPQNYFLHYLYGPLRSDFWL